MKILFTSDWHLDHVTQGVARFEELCHALEQTVMTAIDEKCEAYIFCGDLCDPDTGTSVFRCVEQAQHVAKLLGDEGIHSYWLVGNHDVIEDGNGTSTLCPLREMDSSWVNVVEEPSIHILPRTDLTMAFLPFTSPTKRYEPAEFLEQHKDVDVDLIVGHLNIPGMHPGEETTEMPRGREVMFPLKEANKFKNAVLVNGHYHRAQTKDGIHIPGSLARLTFGEEEHELSFAIWDTETQRWSVRKIEGPKKLVTITELDKRLVERGDIVRLRPGAEEDDEDIVEFANKLRAAGISAVKILPKPKSAELPTEAKTKIESQGARQVVMELAENVRAPEGDKRDLKLYLEDALTKEGL